jgi:hypothetical protein
LFRKGLAKMGVTQSILDIVYFAQNANWLTILQWLATQAGWMKFIKICIFAGIFV